MMTFGRKALQWTMGTLAVIPMASAMGEILRGPQGVPGGSPAVVPTVDSALRYANVFKFASGITVLRDLNRIEQSPATTFALSTIAVGGLARILAWRQSGHPHPVIVGAIALETVGAPLLINWQRRISTTAV